MAEEWKTLIRSEPDTNAELDKHIEGDEPGSSF